MLREKSIFCKGTYLAQHNSQDELVSCFFIAFEDLNKCSYFKTPGSAM